MKKIIYIDTETTGLDCNIHGLRELAYIIEIDGQEVGKGLFYINPITYKKDVAIDEKALILSNKTFEDITGTDYKDSYECFEEFLEVLDKYIDKYNKDDKFIINGYNTQFDIGFLKDWFKDNNHSYFGSYFSYKNLDVFALVGYIRYLGFIDSENDKLETICNYFDIPINAHNALDDIVATKKLNDLLIEKYIKDNR